MKNIFKTMTIALLMLMTVPVNVIADEGHTALINGDYYMFASDMYANISTIGPYFQRSVQLTTDVTDEQKEAAVEETASALREVIDYNFYINELSSDMYPHEAENIVQGADTGEKLRDDGTHTLVNMSYVVSDTTITTKDYWDGGLDCAGSSFVATHEWESERDFVDDFPDIKMKPFEEWTPAFRDDSLVVMLPEAKYKELWFLNIGIEDQEGHTDNIHLHQGVNIIKFTADIGCKVPLTWYEVYYGIGDSVESFYNPEQLDVPEPEPTKAEDLNPARDQFVVTFTDIDGNELTSILVDKGANATFPVAPVVKGMKFVGWDNEALDVQENLEIHPIYKKKYGALIGFVIVLALAGGGAALYFTGKYKAVVLFFLNIFKAKEKATFHGVWMFGDDESRYVKVKGNDFLVSEELIKQSRDGWSLSEFFERAKTSNSKTVFPPKTYMSVTAMVKGFTNDIIADEAADEEYLMDILKQTEQPDALITISLYNYLADFEYEFQYRTSKGA